MLICSSSSADYSEVVSGIKSKWYADFTEYAVSVADYMSGKISRLRCIKLISRGNGSPRQDSLVVEGR